MSGKKPVKIGVIGCGNISPAYFNASQKFKSVQITACADMRLEAAKARAAEYKLEAMTVDALLDSKEIEVVLNLTTPQSHVELNMRALEAGKHAYSEKPLGIDRAEGKKSVDLARKKKLLLGCAPDTFFGGGHQTCRKLIDDGWIGRPVAGTAFMMCRGHERWHPNPAFYYLNGGGPMLDMGPYYLTALVNMLGPVKRVCASTAKTFKERICTCKERNGERLPVEVQTHQAGVVDFASGAVVTVVMTFDVWRGDHNPIEIYGTEGSLKVPDPNGFGGKVLVSRKGGDWSEVPLTHGYAENFRSVGMVDMAMASRSGRAHRCSGDLAYHVLEVMQSFAESSAQGRHIDIKSACERPAPLPLGLMDGELD